ncbi:SPOR domain-containing protein [Cyclobacterium jeungdonense]|uniref:SPOR domain-containing protein n=1 Tax=Cyclobacterium jeungdonense TaxID=708087 RepID=A0ABT8CBL6_9BACT|nr:hypothetical protein [Cyclobacterium jeungdonense]MDN3690203.1 hypothetical protein [Cyclobacterium jeungdonense]
MSENKSKDQNSQANNDEDFGLPDVSVTPLKSPVAGTVAAPDPAPIGMEKTHAGKPEGSEREKKERRSNWALWLILLLILLIGFGAYYWGNFGYLTPNPEEDDVPTAQSEEPVEVTPEPAPVPESIEEAPVVEAVTPVLTEVAGRADSPRYFLVVGSFIDDDLARDYSERLNKAGLETFLVHPYGSIHFYRLAIGQYENLDTALEAMNASQKEYEENLWVLKY